MNDRNLKLLLQSLNKLENHLKERLKADDLGQTDEESISLKIIEENLQNNAKLADQYLRFTSPRKLIGFILDKIRQKFYRESESHLSKVINAQEIFNAETVKYLRYLKNKCQKLEQELNELKGKKTNL